MPKGRKGSLLVLQSGGPTHVINQSLAGVFHEAERSGAFERVLRGRPRAPRPHRREVHRPLRPVEGRLARGCAYAGVGVGHGAPQDHRRRPPRRLRGASGAQRHLPGEHRRQRLRRERPPLLCRGAKAGLPAYRDGRAQDRRQRPPGDGPLPRLRQRGALPRPRDDEHRPGRRGYGRRPPDPGHGGDGAQRGVARGIGGHGQARGARRHRTRSSARRGWSTRTGSWPCSRRR